MVYYFPIPGTPELVVRMMGPARASSQACDAWLGRAVSQRNIQLPYLMEWLAGHIKLKHPSIKQETVLGELFLRHACKNSQAYQHRALRRRRRSGEIWASKNKIGQDTLVRQLSLAELALLRHRLTSSA